MQNRLQNLAEAFCFLETGHETDAEDGGNFDYLRLQRNYLQYAKAFT